MGFNLIDNENKEYAQLVQSGDIVIDETEKNIYRINGCEEGLLFVSLDAINLWHSTPLKYDYHNGCFLDSVKKYMGIHKSLRHIKKDNYNITLEILR